MIYNTDKDGYILNYALIGRVENGIEYKGEITEDFKSCPHAYRVVDGALVVDEARRDEIISALEAESTVTVKSIEERIAAVETALAGSPPLAEMIEALNILLGE